VNNAGRIKELLREHVAELAPHLFPNGHREGSHWCVGSINGEPGKSFKICISGEKAGLWGDFDPSGNPLGKHSRNLLNLWMARFNLDFKTAKHQATQWLGEPLTRSNNGTQSTSKTRPTFRTLDDAIASVERWLNKRATRRDWYHDRNGNEHFVVVRFDGNGGKDFRPFYRNRTGWVMSDPPGKLPLFRLPELIARPNERVFIVEGEKCACDLATLGLLVTTSGHGAESAHKTDWSPLAGRECVILPDNDAGGRTYAQTDAGILNHLSPLAVIKIVELPGLPEKGDCVDWLDARDSQTPEDITAELLALVKNAKATHKAENREGLERGSLVENVENSEAANDIVTSTNSATLPRPEAVWPHDSVLENYMMFARGFSESEDCILIGSILPIVARLLARRVFLRFAGRKYPNLYSLIVTKPGLRKSTSIDLAERIGRALLRPDAFIEGACSEQALFKCYQGQPDKLLIEEEGNTLLSNWASDAAGKIVAKRFLKLYDCKSWTQTYMRQAEENGDALQRIEQTSTSLLIGTTYNNCRFHALETRDGMRRRVNYYLSEKYARTIYWPCDFDSGEFGQLIESFKPLLEIEGEMRLSEQAKETWHALQDSNRAEIQRIVGIDAASEAYGSALAEENAKVLKFAMIFEACRWAADRGRDFHVIQADTLQLAAEHVRHSINASRELDSIGRRAEIREEADSILATIRVEFQSQSCNGSIDLNKTTLTHRFAANPSRRGAMTSGRLYNEILPDLERRGLAKSLPCNGKLQVYQFSVEDRCLD
jgi:hypothetical protein